MQNLQEKIKELLLLSDDDVEPLLKGDFKTLLSQNKEGAVRVGIVYGSFIVVLLLFLSLFSVFGAFGKVILSFMLFGVIAIAAFLAGLKNLLRITQYPAFSYFLLFLFGLMTLSMFSDISSQGSILSKMLLFMIVAGVVAGAYSLRQKAKENGLNLIQLVLAALFAGAFLLSMQAAAVQFGMDREIAMTRQRQEIRRLREAEQMRMNQASTKICTTDEECRKMNTKKNTYYAEYEEIAQETCETAVAKEIQGRFEWTVSARDYKFTSYEVDVLKDDILLIGDRAQLIANDGTKTKITYTCHYNTKKKTTTAAIQQVVK